MKEVVESGHPYKPAPQEEREETHIINGVTLPRYVYEQLYRAIPNLELLPAELLRDAVRAAFIDGQVFDDPAGDDFQDMLHLDDAEMALKQTLNPSHAGVEHAISQILTGGELAAGNSFVERLKKEQEKISSLPDHT